MRSPTTAPPLPALVLAPGARDAWLLLCLPLGGLIYLLVGARRVPGDQRRIFVGGFCVGLILVAAGEVLSLAVYVPWETAVTAWYTSQLGSGCSVAQLNHFYDSAEEAAANPINIAANLLVFTAGIVGFVTAWYRIRHMRRAQSALA